MNAEVETEFDEMVRDYRPACEQLGFRPLERCIAQIEGGYSCTDFLLCQHTFLDLHAFIARGRPPKRVAVGFLGVAFTTFLDYGGNVQMLTQWAQPDPPPHPRGITANFVQRVVAPLLYRITPAEFRPQPLHSPQDLGPLFERHREHLAGRPGRVIEIGDDPLERRWELVRKMDEQADAEENR